MKFNELLDKKIELKVISSESLAGDDGDEQTVLNDSVSSSTTSITSTTSKCSTTSSSSYKVADKTIGKGKEPGRHKTKKRKLDHDNGELSNYSNFNSGNNNEDNVDENVNIDIPASIKSLFQKRVFEILCILLLNKSDILEIIAKTKKNRRNEFNH